MDKNIKIIFRIGPFALVRLPKVDLLRERAKALARISQMAEKYQAPESRLPLKSLRRRPAKKSVKAKQKKRNK